MTEHTHKQFDAEMEAIRSGVLAMGGLVETQLARAIELARATTTTPCSLDQRRRRRAGDQPDAGRRSTSSAARSSRKRQPAAIDLRMMLTVTKIVNDLERIGDEAKKIAYKAAQTRQHRSPHAACGTTTSARAAERAREMLQLALDAFARLDAAAAAEVDRPRRGDRRGVPRDHAPAHQLHDGGSAHDHARRSRSCSSRSRSSASATTRRTSPRRSCRW